MKIISLFIILFSTSLVFCQTNAVQIDSLPQRRINNKIAAQVSFQGSAFTSLDDNFISQAYSQDLGFSLEIRFGVKEFFGIGFNYNRYEFSLDDTRFLGSNFPSSRFHTSSIFGYYQQPFISKLTGEIKLGVFHSNLKNRAKSDTFLGNGNLKLDFTGLMTGLKMVYYLSEKKQLGISLGADVYYSLSDTVNTAVSELDFINKNTFSSLNVGIVLGN